MYCKYCGEQMNDNQNVCLKCGVATGTGNAYCANCGNRVNPEAVICVNCGVSLKSESARSQSPEALAVKPRELVKAILLTIFTCGIYGIYWFISITNELNALTDRNQDTRGGMCYLLGILTCGIYLYYWAYKMGEKRDLLDGKTDGACKIVYLIVMLFVPIVVYALIQDAINKSIQKN